MAFGLFRRDEHGSVTVLSAILLPVMIGVGALVLEYGGGLLAKVRLQRVADIAAFAAATAYAKNSSPSAITPAAQQIGRLNGVESSAVSAALVASPRGDGSQVVQATVSIARPIYLARVLGVISALDVSATAYASVGAGVGPCITALSSSGAGVTLSGGTSLTAATCAINSNVSIVVPCGTTVTAKEATYAGSTPSAPCSGLKDPAGGALAAKQKAATDPLTGDAGVAAATGRVSTVNASTAPAAPTVATGKPIEFAWNQATTISQATAIGCTATWSQPTWTLTCPSGGTYNFGTFSIGGGIAVKFALAATAATRFNFSEKVPLSGSTVEFGAGNFAFSKGISIGGGTTVTFGAGTFSFGRGTDTCGDGLYSICHTGTALTFGGPSTFTYNSGIYVGGGTTTTFGAGSTNSYDIGPSSSGHSITMGGGAKMTFADATSADGLFRLSGNLNMLSGGGSCITTPAAAHHDIKGYFATAGGTTLGAGVYTVTGYIAFGAGSGGDVSCNGQTVGVKGVGVTLVTAGGSTYGSGACQGKAFCVGSGYATVSLTAPASGATSKLVVVGPSSGTAGAAFVQGAGASMSGVFYFPRGPISMSGGASLGNGASQCLQIIGSEITLTGGTTAASSCVSGSNSSGAVAVIQ